MKLKSILLTALAAVLLCTGAASAATISFGDSVNYWPGFEAEGRNSGQNGKDVLNMPNILGGSVTATQDIGRSISFDYEVDSKYYKRGSDTELTRSANRMWNSFGVGDIFIDTNPTDDFSANSWDYVITTSGSGGIYALTGFNYFDNYYDTGDRDNQPVTVDGFKFFWGEMFGDVTATKIGDAVLTSSMDVPEKNGIGTVGWDLTYLNMDDVMYLAGDVMIGWGVTCGNDVLLERVILPAPEPATWALMSLGLLGIVALRRRRAL